MKLSPGLTGLALLVVAIPLGAGFQRYAASAASEPQPAAGRPAIPGLKAPGGTTSTLSALTVVAPATGPLNPGGPVLIHWTGGVSSWTLTLVLVDYDAWQSLGAFATASNSGSQSYNWTLPSSPAVQPPLWDLHRRGNPVTWTYGPVFRLKCDVQVVKSHTLSTYVIKLVNGNYPIAPLLNPASQQTASVPIFTVTDTVPLGLTLTSGVGTGPGTWTPASFTTPITNTSKTFVYRMNTPSSVMIPPAGLIATYTFQATPFPKNCASEAMSVSDALVLGNTIALNDVIPANNTAICAP